MQWRTTILEIFVVQNTALWTVFQNEKKRLRDKLEKNPTSELLWHGTRTINPEKLIRGHDGFDLSVISPSKNRGPGVYFVNDASLVHEDGFHNHIYTQTFLAEVLVDEAVSMPSGKNYKTPDPSVKIGID